VAVREPIRRALAQWGMPVRIRVDNGAPWGSWGDFPTALALWVIGLGVRMHWNHPRTPQENGVVERSQGTSDRWCEPWTCATPDELQERLERMDRLYRESYPYRQRLSRMEFYPGLRHSGRPYERALEPRLWEWSRVAEHISTYVVVRHVDRSGLVSLYDKGHYVGKIHEGKKVFVMYDPCLNEWVFSDREGRQLRRLPADQLSRERVMELNVKHRS
jgi:transposase InsO family protein